VNERTDAQLRVIKAVVNTLEAAGISAWLFGGWGLDARIGRITREHGDVEFWVERIDAERSKAVLAAAGATALATQPPEEACEFTWDGVDFSTAYFDRHPDGSFIQLEGRWSDWRFPPGSFGDEPGTLDGAPVLAMSVAGMLAMKEQYPHLRNGGPWRQKDIDDIKVLRELAAAITGQSGYGGTSMTGLLARTAPSWIRLVRIASRCKTREARERPVTGRPASVSSFARRFSRVMRVRAGSGSSQTHRPAGS
jgi:hypothetical protein